MVGRADLACRICGGTGHTPDPERPLDAVECGCVTLQEPTPPFRVVPDVSVKEGDDQPDGSNGSLDPDLWSVRDAKDATLVVCEEEQTATWLAAHLNAVVPKTVMRGAPREADGSSVTGHAMAGRVEPTPPLRVVKHFTVVGTADEPVLHPAWVVRDGKDAVLASCEVEGVARWLASRLNDGPSSVMVEVSCVDCGCAIVDAAERGEDGIYHPVSDEPRCDTDRDHHAEDCGEDCPVVCPGCKEHHFAPYCVAAGLIAAPP